jgi:signal transduction histidine kinase/CheY-like chemotaxis protein
MGIRYRERRLRQREAELEATVAARTAELAEKARELSDAVTRLEVSEKQALDAKEEAVEASRAKSVFLSNMSHELRTPLNAVIGFAQLMSRDARLGPEQRQNLAVIHRSGEHLLDLINDVLSISKIEAGRLTLSVKPFDPRRLLQSVRAMIALRAEEKGIALAFDVDRGFPPSVHGDEGKLRQVLLNLLGNAVKFTDRGDVRLRARHDGRVARFEVEDTGPGIAEREIGRLFAAFSQTESGRSTGEGSGLGLVISRNIVRMMGGDLRLVRTAVGEGTLFAFEVDLPAAAGEASGPARRVAGLAPGQRAHRILVVDDTAENRLLLVKLLCAVGFEVFEASNGAEAVTAWEELRPDLIWMDMRMPVMDGMEATRRIRSAECSVLSAELENPEPRAISVPTQNSALSTQHSALSTQHSVIIALTASAFEHERDAFLASGADDMIVKPFREETIFEKLAEHLGVRFRYEEPAGPAAASAGNGSVTPERLGALPPEIVEALRLALLTGDPGATRDVARRIEPLDEPLAAEILAAVRSYRFEDLLAAVESGN